MKRFGWVAGLMVLALSVPVSVAAQDEPAGESALNLFFDCQGGGCHDLDFFRREVPVVNWVRDRESADLQVIVTSQRTGGGGSLYTLSFIGLRAFQGVDQTLEASTAGDATTDDQRRAVSSRLKMGLVRYLQGTPAADRFQILFDDPAAARGPGGRPGGPPGQAASPADDPWNFWVFSISGNGFVNGQSTSQFSNIFSSVSANRTTEAWKFTLGGNYSRNKQSFDVQRSDGTRFTVSETREDWGANASLVKSIGAQWALGVRANTGSSTFLNQDFRWSVSPGVEYNFFPYSESSRRSLTFQYLIGPTHFDYTEVTIFDELAETRVEHELTGRLSLVEPWGRWSTSLSSQQFLHDAEKYSVTLSGSVDVRLFRGFSVRVSGNYSWIRNQLFIEAGDASEEQILLQQRQLETSFRYFTSFGITYRFGSIFNNVVNPRFGGGGGGEFFFF